MAFTKNLFTIFILTLFINNFIFAETDNILLNQPIKFTKQFTDIDHHPAKQAIQLFTTAFNISGYMGSPAFQPDYPITRAELAWFFCEIKEIQPIQTKKNIFPDVPKNHWAAGYIEAIAPYSLFSRIDYAKFAPDSYITRLEWIEMIANLQQIHDFPTLRPISPDLAANLESNKWLVVAVNHKWLPSTWKIQEEFGPYLLITRAEACSSLMRLPLVQEIVAQKLDLKPTDTTEKKRIAPPKRDVELEAIWTDPDIITTNGQIPITLFVKLNKKQGNLTVVADLSALGRLEDCTLTDINPWTNDYNEDAQYSGIVRLAPGISNGEKVIPLSIRENQKSIISAEAIVTVLYANQYLKSINQDTPPPEIQSKTKSITRALSGFAKKMQPAMLKPTSNTVD